MRSAQSPVSKESQVSDLPERIARFEHMTAADPDNEMAHFSLGSLYLEAGRPSDAATRFRRVLEINPEMSKAWQMAGTALIQAGERDAAKTLLLEGHRIAAGKGDRLPEREMANLLQSVFGIEPPKVSAAPPDHDGPAGDRFICSRTGRRGTRMSAPPFRGPVGAWIREHITQETWTEWIGQGTKVINELRLDFSREEDQATYDRYMHEFLGLDAATLAQLRSASAVSR